MKSSGTGFTLIELMVVIAILGILLTIGIAQYNGMLRKSTDGQTKGNLATLRSAISIYYSDNYQTYPFDDLATLTIEKKYLDQFPATRISPYHLSSAVTTNEIDPTDTGGWSYNNDSASLTWGAVRVGCTHTDYKGDTWSTY